MSFLSDPEFWARWVSIVIIDVTLAGDNALLIALAVRTLGPRERFWGRVGGAAGAVPLRLSFITIITFLLQVPLLQLAGGLLLVWIALKLVRQGTGREGRVREGTTLFRAIWIIVVADVVMSLDNVLAIAAAAQGDLLLVAMGIGLSLPLVVWGSGLLAALMDRFAWIVWLGGGILGFVAGEMVLRDPVVRERLGQGLAEALHYPLPVLLGVGIAGVGWRLGRGRGAASVPERP